MSVLSLTLLSASIFAANQTTTKATLYPNGVTSTGKVNVQDITMPPYSLDVNHQPRPKRQSVQKKSKEIDISKVPFVAPNTTLVAPSAVEGVIFKQTESYPSSTTGITANKALEAGSYHETPDLSVAAYKGWILHLGSGLGHVINERDLNAVPSDFSLSTLFGGAQIDSARAWFDSESQKWFMVAFNNDSDDAKVHIAVSLTTDVLGDYYTYQFSGKTTLIPGCNPACNADYMHYGYNQDVMVLTFNLSGKTDGYAVNAIVYAVPIGPLLTDSQANLYNVMDPEFHQHLAPSVLDYSDVPQEQAGGNVVIFDVKGDFRRKLGDELGVSLLTGTAGAGTGGDVYLTTTSVKITPFMGPVPVGQPYTSTKFDGGLAAISSHVQQVGNYFMASFPISVLTASYLQQTAIRYILMNINVSGQKEDPSIRIQVIGDKNIVFGHGYNALNPAVAVNSKGSGILTTTITNPNPAVPGSYPSCIVMKIKNFLPSFFAYITANGSYPAEDGTPTVQAGKYNHTTCDSAGNQCYSACEGKLDEYKRDNVLHWTSQLSRMDE